jgi:hypothetical protein
MWCTIFCGGIVFRDIVRKRLERGPILRRLREEFFKAATQIFDPDEFLVAFRKDLENLNSHALVISPFLNRIAVEKFCNLKEVSDALKKGKKIVVVTRLADPREVDDPKEHETCINMLENCGIKVIPKPRFHFKAVIIDDSIIYIGSINPLQIITVRYIPADYMLRFVSEALVDEIIEKFIPDYQEWLK